MNRRGAALLGALVALTALGVIVGAAARTAHDAATTSRNRGTLLRAEWALEACLEVLRADGGWTVDSLALGQGVWCRARVQAEAGKLNIATAASTLVAAGIADPVQEASLLDWRDPDTLARGLGAEEGWYLVRGRRPPRNAPFGHVRELGAVRGFERTPVESLEARFTVRGSGRLAINHATGDLLSHLPGFDAEVVNTILRTRRTGVLLRSLDDLATHLSSSGRVSLIRHWEVLLRLVTFEEEGLTAYVEGGVGSLQPRARLVVDLAQLGGRLVVLGRDLP